MSLQREVEKFRHKMSCMNSLLINLEKRFEKCKSHMRRMKNKLRILGRRMHRSLKEVREEFPSRGEGRYSLE
jgi:hypothetical protein